MRVKFSRDYDYIPSGEPRVTLAYKAGTEETVKQEAGEAAIKAGAAEAVEAAPPAEAEPKANARRG